MNVLITDIYIKKSWWEWFNLRLQALSVKLLLCHPHFQNYWNLYVSVCFYIGWSWEKKHLCKLRLFHSFISPVLIRYEHVSSLKLKAHCVYWWIRSSYRVLYFYSCASWHHVPKRSAGHDLMGMNLGETILKQPQACRVESQCRMPKCCS